MSRSTTTNAMQPDKGVETQGFSAHTQIGEANGWIVTVVADDFNVYIFHQFRVNNDDPRASAAWANTPSGYGLFGFSYIIKNIWQISKVIELKVDLLK